MTESPTPPKSFKTIHWVALVLLFLMMAQPTFDNTRALMSGKMVMGDLSIDVTPAKMALHLVAMAVGWIGIVLFFKRKKIGAYVSIAAHIIGFVAVFTQTPEMLEMMPPAALGVFYVILFAITLGPIFKFKEQYT